MKDGVRGHWPVSLTIYLFFEHNRHINVLTGKESVREEGGVEKGRGTKEMFFTNLLRR
jgi:hypothetical protein